MGQHIAVQPAGNSHGDPEREVEVRLLRGQLEDMGDRLRPLREEMRQIYERLAQLNPRAFEDGVRDRKAGLSPKQVNEAYRFGYTSCELLTFLKKVS